MGEDAVSGDDIARVSVLSDETRRALYEYVSAQPHPVTRDQASAALGVPVHTAKFHLDKLESVGLLRASYARRTGRTGPGAGRPAKLYERAEGEVAVTLPAREYALAGDLMAQAIARAARDGIPVAQALDDAAHEKGRSIGSQHRASGSASAFELALSALRDYGYEPRVEDGEIVMANCPFHQLAGEHTDLVCGMNHDLLEGFADAIAPGHLIAELRPGPGRCCVTMRMSACSSGDDT
ncbi:helix-turn-helix transcriptional regulator [Paramicrobacterium sp. CJ85]|uniref:helix-turn-helix transcriptional regulator n=1 Tax=Paramicrobacterium sp. CJ85 TaxID=3445355 RepID=UPI003F6247C0